MPNSLGDLFVDLGLNTKPFDVGMSKLKRTMKNVGKDFKAMGQGMKNVGSQLTTKLTLPIAGLGLAVSKLAMDFESGMSEVKAISGATAEQMGLLEKKALKMGETTKFSAKESAQAMKFMALAGWSTTKIIDGLDGVMKLASASGEDLALVSDIVTDSMTGFGLSAKKAGMFADVLAITSARSNTNVAMLGEAFKFSAPIAGALGFSVQDVSIALGLMANSGIKASMAGTSLRAIITRLAKPTKQSSEAISELGIELKNSDGSMKSLRDILKQIRGNMNDLEVDQKAMFSGMLAGQNAISGMLSIVNASEEDFNKLTHSIDNAKGSAKNMSDIMQDNLRGQITKLKSALEGLGIQLGKIILPILKELVTNRLMPLVKGFSELSPEMKKSIVMIGGIIATLGPLIGILGMVVSGIGTLITALSSISLPVLGVIAGLTILTGTLIKLWKENENFRVDITKTWKSIKTNIEIVLKAIKELAIKIWSDISNYLDNNGKEIMNNFKIVWKSILLLTKEYFKTLKTAFVKMTKIFSYIWDNFGTDILDVVKNNFDFVIIAISGAFKILTGLLKIFRGVFAGDWQTMWEGMKDVAVGIIDTITGMFENLIKRTKKLIEIVGKAMGLFNEKVDSYVESRPRLGDEFKTGIPNFNSSLTVTKPKAEMTGEIGQNLSAIPTLLPKAKSFVVNVTGNNIYDDMDIDIIADKMMKKLKIAGIN